MVHIEPLGATLFEQQGAQLSTLKHIFVHPQNDGLCNGRDRMLV